MKRNINNIFYERLDEPINDKYNLMSKISFPPLFQNIISNLKSLKISDDVGKTLRSLVKENIGLKEGSLYESSAAVNTYRYKNFEIMTGIKSMTDDYLKKIEFLNELEINTAPRLVDYFEIERKTVFVTSIPNLNTEYLIKYKKGKHLVADKNKKSFLSDMSKLAENGFAHDYAPLGYNHWYVNPDNGDIYLNSWGALRSLENNEKESLLNEIKKLLES